MKLCYYEAPAEGKEQATTIMDSTAGIVDAEVETEVAETNVCCANCDIAGGDINLKKCAACGLVRYCNVECQREHRPRHKKACKKRGKELHDQELFTQPDETHLGECPICFLPLPLDPSKSGFGSCCSNVICKGCDYANDISGGGDRCPFCREPATNMKEFRKRLTKRVKANDPAALRHMGATCYTEGNYDAALEYFTKAAKLGDLAAHYKIGVMYWQGEGVEKNEEKAVYHFEIAAIGGHPGARHGLACIEGRNGNIERSVKHFIIGANLGCVFAMKKLWKHYSDGNITKKDLDATLRSHQAALDAMKSEQRYRADVEADYLQRMGA